MAAHVFKGTAILLIAIHLFLSTPLTTTPHPLLLSVFLLPFQKPRTAFKFLVLSLLNSDLPLPFRAHVRQVVGLLIVFR